MSTKERRRVRLMLACAVGALTSAPVILTAAGAHAQSTTIGEVVVTARKRSESVQKIPVAVTTQTGTQLEQKRITQPTELQHIVPSLQITLVSGGDNGATIALRGQAASDTLLGVSQPVGLYEDTVNIPHPFGANNAFFDISRIEVLAGPQGTLYGRNTTAGAINIITKNADYNGYHGFIEGEVGNFNDAKVGVAVNAPIIDDKLAVRLAYQHWSQDGFGSSKITGQKFGNDHNDDTARLSVKFDPTSNFDVNFKFEYSQALHTAPMITDTYLNPSPASFYPFASAALYANPAFWPTVAGAAAGNGADAVAVAAAGEAVLHGCVLNLGGDYYHNCSATHQVDDLHSYHGVLDMKWDITGDTSLRSITGVHSFHDYKIFDLDAVQAQMLEVGLGSNTSNQLDVPVNFKLNRPLGPDQESTQWSQELDLAGKEFDGRMSWLVGAFGSWDLGSGNQQSYDAVELTRALDEAGFGGANLPGEHITTSAHDGQSNSNQTWALFTQDDFRLTDKFTITAGLRYTEERLEQSLSNWYFDTTTGNYYCNGDEVRQVVTNPATCSHTPEATGNYNVNASGIPLNSAGNPIIDPITGIKLPGALGLPAFVQHGAPFQHGTFSGTSYLLSFNFQLTPNMLLYVKTARGFRGGAFGRNYQTPAAPETDTDYEAGFKGDFFGHRLRTNLAAYLTNYDNKQVSIQICSDGTFPSATGCGAGLTDSTVLLNAAKARIEGVELEWQAAPITGLSLYGNVSYVYGYYISFPGAPLSVGGQFDAANQNIGGQPEWQGNVGARYERAFGPGVAGLQLDYTYRGAIPLNPITTDPNIPASLQNSEAFDGAVGLLNGRVDYKIASQGLTFSLWGTNLTNEKWGYEGITSAYTGGIGTEITQPPLTYGFSVRKSFGGE